MKIKETPKAEIQLRKEIRELTEDVKELAEIRDRLMKENKDLEVKNEKLQRHRLLMYDSLMLERIDLEGRINRINQRILTLGFVPPKMYGQQEIPV